MHSMNPFPVWLMAATLCGCIDTSPRDTTVLLAETTNHSTIYIVETVSVVPQAGNAPTTTSTASAIRTTPFCDTSSNLTTFIIQPGGSDFFFEPSWNATSGGFELVDAATAETAMTFYIISSACDDNEGFSFPICGLQQLAFNYTCPEDGVTTEYNAWVTDIVDLTGPVTFFNATAEVAASESYGHVLVEDFNENPCSIDLLFWEQHDSSTPFLVDGTLWVGGGDDSVPLLVFPPLAG